MSLPTSLAAWLDYLATLHPRAIALGLDRTRAVYARLRLGARARIVTVAGTNGKGSTCAFIERMLACAGYRVGLYSSPHLLRYNERVRTDGAEASDDALCEAFAAVEAARDNVPLTYFEFGTLAALWLFARQSLDAWVLEVGLGGRLDAVNIVDADVAVVTGVAIDHVDWLGDNREAIGLEKAGIFRAGRPAIVGDRDPPASVVRRAGMLECRLLRIGVDYDVVADARQWSYRGPGGARHGLPHPALRGAFQLDNAATAITAVDALADTLPVSAGALREALVEIELPGRFQVLPGRPQRVLDVAHNPQAAAMLASTLGTMGFAARTTAVFGIMADKDVDGVIAALRPRIDAWNVTTLPPPRGVRSAVLRERLHAAGVDAGAIREFDDPATAYRAAIEASGEADRIVAFGSFLTVAGALAA